MQTISTKFYGATNTRGSRIIARTASGVSFTSNYQHALNSDENHWRAAQGLAKKLDWSGDFIQGDTATGCVFVFADDTRRNI
jgi:hypothetical protein